MSSYPAFRSRFSFIIIFSPPSQNLLLIRHQLLFSRCLTQRMSARVADYVAHISADDTLVLLLLHSLHLTIKLSIKLSFEDLENFINLLFKSLQASSHLTLFSIIIISYKDFSNQVINLSSLGLQQP